ncbi:PTS sugar transporter subunit IIA [Clostridium sp.]|uniref:PTS sugar transporter subunit IIA n=1 Tax=Clostridium sp. TaxID=1506 RepID=UPI00290CFC08|nr:PTS sugar transporter subunit IIA [Clostridium sp.]MDU5107297.1 PTS sugar transporter subunit IIA [Clostridium sp.]
MIGILLVTHGDFAEGIKNSTELIVGKSEKFTTLGLYHGDSIDDFNKKVLDYIIDLDDGNGVLVFSDLYCATPFNSTVINNCQLKEHDYRSISGINLPMLIEALTCRDNMDLEKLSEHVMDMGKNGIKELFKEMSNKK